MSALEIKCFTKYNLFKEEAQTAWSTPLTPAVGDMVVPAVWNGYVYICTVSGAVGGSEPTFGTTEGGSTTDNAATWIAVKNRIEPDVDTLKVLFTNAEPVLATDKYVTDVVSDEISPSVRLTLANVTITENSAVIEIDCDNLTIPYDAGGAADAEWIVFYKEIGGSDQTRQLIGFGQFDSAKDIGNAATADTSIVIPTAGFINYTPN